MQASLIKPGRQVRILIVSYHPLVRAGFKALIRKESDLQVCREAANLVETIEMVKECSPDLLMVHLNLADAGGFELIKRLHARYSTLRVLICSMDDDSRFVARAIRAGADGYINEQEVTDHLIDAIHRVMSGDTYLSANTSQKMLLDDLGDTVDSVNILTNRELEVFNLIGLGVSTSRIAEQLHLSVKTIESHREKIKRKLHLASAGELARYAIKWTLEHNG